MKRLLITAIAAIAMTGQTARAQDSFQTPKAGTIKLDVRLSGIVPDESVPPKRARTALMSI